MELVSRVYCYSNRLTQMVEQYPVRGYLSSADNRLHIGFANKKLDSLKIIWPDGKMQIINNPSINKIFALNYKDASNVNYQTNKPLPLFFN